MKFTLNSITNHGRLGKLSEFTRLPGKVLETPLLLLNTKGASIPHVTHEVLQLLTKENQGIQIPIASTLLTTEAVKEFSKGISQFCGLKDCVTYCSVQDPSVATPPGYNKKEVVSVWTHIGRVSVDAKKYMESMEAFQPDFYQTLTNSDTNLESSKKRLTKTVLSAKSLFEQCLKKHQESEILKERGFVGAIEGGYDLEQRKIFAEYMSAQPVDGYAIEGLHNNGPETENFDDSKVTAVIKHTVEHLPEDKFRIVPGCWKPLSILKMVSLGVDIFDSSLPYIVTERMSALIFNWSLVPGDSESCSKESVPIDISLNDPKYKEDFGPLCEQCTCLACRKHTRAYIFHLLENKELLASTLLMMHNLHHYMEFFKTIRTALSQNKKVIIV